MLPSNSHIHIHKYNSNLHYSWLDHIVSSHSFHQTIREISICYNTTDEDHIPLSFVLCSDNLPATSDTVNDISAKIRWDGVSDTNRKLYYSNSHVNLGKVPIPIATVCCTHTLCDNQEHRLELDHFFKDIVGALQDSSRHVVTNQSKHQNRPGWSDYVAELYQFSRETYKLWQDNGKPRQGPINNIYTQSKRRFKYALRYIKKHETTLGGKKLLKSTLKKPKDFVGGN